MEDILGFDDDDTPAIFRKERFGVEQFTDEKKLITWLNNTRTMPLEAIDDAMVNKTYAAAVWLFRSSAICGNLNQTRALKMWLDWAQPVINKSKRDRKAPPKSPGSVAFLARNPGEKDEV